MKMMTLTLGLALFSTPTFAAQVTAAKLDASQKNIIVSVVYGGGCHEHKFKLNVGGCAESFPVQCSASIEDVTAEADPCEALVGKDVTFNIAELGLNDGYHSGGSLRIVGDKDFKGRVTEATVRLPKAGNDAVAPVSNQGPIRCLTHTGSDLKINRDQKTVRLESLDGSVTNIRIVKIDSIVLESMPTQDEDTFSLDDGRKIITTFHSDKNEGRGVYIRVNGESSPEFTCRR